MELKIQKASMLEFQASLSKIKVFSWNISNPCPSRWIISMKINKPFFRLWKTSFHTTTQIQCMKKVASGCISYMFLVVVSMFKFLLWFVITLCFVLCVVITLRQTLCYNSMLVLCDQFCYETIFLYVCFLFVKDKRRETMENV